jgi:beta-glucosidase
MRFLLAMLLPVLVLGLIASDLPAADQKSRTAESAVTPCNRNPKRHGGFLKRIKDGPVGLLFLGDSITDFWPGKSKETWSKFAPYQPADFGISGERTEDVLWRITNGELDGIDPKAVVIMIGTNNIGHYDDEKPEWVAAGVKKIVATVLEKLPKTKILLLGVFPRGATKDDPKRVKVTAINEIIKGYGNGSNVIYLDLTDKFVDAKGDLPKDIMPDALHPNAKGYQIWYDAMWPTLEKLLK